MNRVYFPVSKNCISHSPVSHLIDPAVDGGVEDAGHEEGLHVRALDVQLARDELDLDAGVGLDQLDQHLVEKGQNTTNLGLGQDKFMKKQSYAASRSIDVVLGGRMQ